MNKKRKPRKEVKLISNQTSNAGISYFSLTTKKKNIDLLSKNKNLPITCLIYCIIRRENLERRWSLSLIKHLTLVLVIFL